MTGKKLLEKGELQRRYTIIPLNKISARILDDKVVNTAKSLVREQTIACFGEYSHVVKYNIFLSPSFNFLFRHFPPPPPVRLERTTSTQLCPWWAMNLTCGRRWSMSLAPRWCATLWTMPKKWLLTSMWWPRLSHLAGTYLIHREPWVEVRTSTSFLILVHYEFLQHFITTTVNLFTHKNSITILCCCELPFTCCVLL